MKTLVIYKKSIYQIYVLERKNPLYKKRENSADLIRMKKAHEAHARALERVEQTLRKEGVPFTMQYRSQARSFASCELVITVGGDGTFLEASHGITSQWILGVNSDPDRSVGHYCAATAGTFEGILRNVLDGQIQPRRLNRIRFDQNGNTAAIHVLNDILVCHINPAAMSRYELQIGKRAEEQRGSGIWICTAAGSTAAMKSAGGFSMPAGSKRLQYKPRELFYPPGSRYSFTGGFIRQEEAFHIRSMMREGLIFIDGSHHRFPFPYGDTLHIYNSPYPLHAIV